MELYVYGALISLALAYAFYRMHDGWLRKILIIMFLSFSFYQGSFVLIYLTSMTHGTWYSYWARFPFLVSMGVLLIYIIGNFNNRNGKLH